MNSILNFSELGVMTSLLGARISRSFHTSVVRFQLHKDVDKLNGDQAPFDEDQKKDILKKINSLTEKELWPYATKQLSKQMNTYQ